MCPSPSQEAITPEMIKSIERLIGNRDEVNLEWLKTVTQIPVTTLSKIIIQEFGMVILEGIIYSKEKAEKKLQQRQEELQNKVNKESFRKGPVKIDMMKLRENLWTAYLPERLFGQERHQFCPIWKYLEDNPESKIILRYDWIKRLEAAITKNSYKNLRIIEARSILNEIGDEFKGKAKIVFAKPFPRSSVFGENNVNWVLFIISFARSSLSSSTKESPTSYPRAFQNVNIIAPPIRKRSAFFIKFSMTPILSDTLAPPSMTTNGFS